MDFWSVTAFQALLRCSRSLNLSDNDACCGPGAEGMNPIVRAEMKRAALVQLARGEPPQKLQAVVDFISSTLLRSHPEQHISGQPVAKAWDRVPAPRPRLNLPSTQLSCSPAHSLDLQLLRVIWHLIEEKTLFVVWRDKWGNNYIFNQADSFSIIGMATRGVLI